jgi:hypothetical protein
MTTVNSIEDCLLLNFIIGNSVQILANNVEFQKHQIDCRHERQRYAKFIRLFHEDHYLRDRTSAIATNKVSNNPLEFDVSEK